MGPVELKSTTQHAVLWVVAVTVGALILLQSFKEFVASVYYYSLVGLGASPMTGLLILFLVPLVTGPLMKWLGPRNSFMISGAVMLAGRLPMGMGLESPFHLVASGVAYASSAVFLSLSLALHRRERQLDPDAFSSQALAGSFGLALLILLTLASLGRGLDASIIPRITGMVLAPGLSALICGVGVLSLWLLKDARVLDDERAEIAGSGSRVTGGAADSWAPMFGLAGFLFFSLGIVANPSVTSAWIGISFQWALSMSIVSVGLFLLSLLSSSGYLLDIRRSLGHPKGAVIGNIIMMGGALNLFYFHFPSPTAPAAIVGVGMVNIWLVLDAITDHHPFAGESFKLEGKGRERIIGFPAKSKQRAFPGHFGRIVAYSLGIITLILALITLSLNWSFIPLGTVLKGAIPTFMLGGMLMFALGGFSCSKPRISEPAVKLSDRTPEIDRGSPTIDAGKGSGHLRGHGEVSSRLRAQWITIGAATILLIILTGILSISFYSASLEDMNITDNETFRVVTYNVHHGYANDGRVDPSVQLDVLEDIDADIIFLQESDSLRFTEGNFDPAFYYASMLGMHYFRGPNPGTGTPGVAILSRFSMSDTEVHFLPADDIDRIAISAEITLAEKKVRIVSLHMGLEEAEREKQLEELEGLFTGFLEEYDGLIVGGDLNTEPHEEMMARMNPLLFGGNHGSYNVTYNGTGLMLQSAWHSADEVQRNGPLDINTYPASDVDDEKAHIDYILFNDKFEVETANVLDIRGASDHKPVWADLEIRP